MKSFLWRLRSNAAWFPLALAVFTAIYLLLSYADIRYGHHSFYFSHADPFIVSLFVSFAFFMFYTKRYTYEEEYLYGRSRRYSFCATQCGAVVYALLFAAYALGVALLVRRSFVSGDVIVPAELYAISAAEIFFNFLSLFVVDMLMFEIADIFRKFKTWKFWAAIAVFAVSIFAVCKIFAVVTSAEWFNYWVGMFVIFPPLVVIAAACDWFMTRGRQYR